VTETELQISRALGFIAALIVAVVVQRLAPHARCRASWRVNGALWVVNGFLVGVVCGGCAFTAARCAADVGVGLLNVVQAGPWVAVPLTLVALDLVSYGWHRANHRVPLLWRLHAVHHSDPTFTVSTGIRFHPGELLLSLPVRLVAVVLIGAPAVGVLIFEVVFTLANLLEHGDINLPARAERALAAVVITPAVHRRHHTKVGPQRDSNFGTIFSAWDQLFATYTPTHSSTQIETGLPGLGDVTIAKALALPFRHGPL
jgi:sterol desaturase/sphingolipid hydroxylase (fatty acid hydroxylase superfamily)